ncbi:uncharacterized protein LOC135832704 [Planococcus citri]|uniref:uncharacterized protein LOC135832704 n=1 Tax=Planococcus citri TaxID=170843 RepID=UPI0031F9F47F
MELNSNLTIQFANVRNDETFPFSIIIVKGCVCGDLSYNTEDEIHVGYLDHQGNTFQEKCYKLVDKKFSLLLCLKPGINDFLFTFKTVKIRQTYHHVSPSVKFVVSPTFIICKGEDIPYHSVEKIKDKVNVGCKLIQTLIAEILYEYGFGRKTFALTQEDANGNGDGSCLIFHSKLDVESAATMSSEELWEYFGREIMTSEHGFKNRKFLAFLSHGQGKISQNLAIGGGGLALCSAEYVRSWPGSIDGINNCFNNEVMHNFSLTNNIKNNLSSSLGAVCHELCHTFDLGHTTNGIMGGDFDRIGIIFSSEKCALPPQVATKIQNLNCKGSKRDCLIVHQGTSHRKLRINYSVNCNIFPPSVPASSFLESCTSDVDRTTVLDEKTKMKHIFPTVSFLSIGCASLLAYHKWINQSSFSIKNININSEIDECSTLRYDAIRNIVTSTFSLVLIQLRNHDGYVLKSWEFFEKKPKTLFLVPICESRKADFIVIQDIKGNLLKRDIEHFLTDI